jgi:hypothetical protein
MLLDFDKLYMHIVLSRATKKKTAKNNVLQKTKNKLR